VSCSELQCVAVSCSDLQLKECDCAARKKALECSPGVLLQLVAVSCR